MQTYQNPSLSHFAAESETLTPFEAPGLAAKKTDPCSVSVVTRACAQVAGFEELYHRLERKIALSGRSLSTLKDYSRQIAQIALHFNRLPTELDYEQIQDYLYLVKSQRAPSDSFFKHAVYGLRFVLRLEGLDERVVELPQLKRDKKLPVVLSKQEVKALLIAPVLLKHRLLLAITYGCGLRCSEVRNLKVKDVDLDRGMLHVRQGKGRKDRYVPLGQMLKRGMLQYLEAEQPKEYLFAGKDHTSAFSQQGVQWVVKEARKKAKILKPLCVHTLRHSYATHLLEDGLDILSIKDLLGHESIETTLIYLHIARVRPAVCHSPLDTLYPQALAGQTAAPACPAQAATKGQAGQ
jgi:site-specific recombinase XerD